MVEHAEQDNELSSESIKAIAESVGVKDLNGDCTAYLAKQALLQVCGVGFCFIFTLMCIRLHFLLEGHVFEHS